MKRAFPILLAACSGSSTPVDPRIGLTELDSTICGRKLAAPKATEASFEVDCSGIDVVQQVDTTVGNTSIPVLGAPDDLALCQLYMREPLVTPVQNLRIGFAEAMSTGVAAITVFHGGTTWRSYDGCMKLDRTTPASDPAGAIGIGEYEVIVQEIPLGSLEPSGRYGIARGRVDWCQYGRRTDCPVQFSTKLSKNVEIDGPGGFVDFRRNDAFRGVTGKATACRALVDRSTGALRVDLELGVYQTLPITQFGTACFGNGRVQAPLSNHFFFESGGVTGPGSYGPFERCANASSAKPYFALQVPRTWEGASGNANYCVQGYLSERSQIAATVDSICSFTLNESRFELSCTNAEWRVLGRSPGSPQHGDFSLKADCDLEYR